MYHAKWAAGVRDGANRAMIEFGEALPRLRRRLRATSLLSGLPRDKVLAVVVGLLDVSAFAIR